MVGTVEPKKYTLLSVLATQGMPVQDTLQTVKPSAVTAVVSWFEQQTVYRWAGGGGSTHNTSAIFDMTPSGVKKKECDTTITLTYQQIPPGIAR